MASLIDVFNGQTRDLIDAAVAKNIKPSRFPYRIKASEIAHQCERRLWADFRHLNQPEQVVPIQQRVFDRGNHIEDAYIADLKLVENFEVVDTEWDEYKWEDRQIGVSFADGHGFGYLDLEIKGLPEAPKTWHVGEVKSAKQVDYNALVKHGVKKHKPLWYGQGHIYALKRDRDRIVFFVECKNDQQRIPLRFTFDAEYGMQLEVKAERIAFAEVPPVRAAAKKGDRICLFCKAEEWCWAEKHVDLPKTCRTCRHIEPISKGKWACNRVPNCQNILNRDEQEAGCEWYQIIPAVRHWATMTGQIDERQAFDDGYADEVPL